MKEDLEFQVEEFALELAAIQNNSDLQTLVVLQEVTAFFVRVADIVDTSVGNSSSNSTIQPMVCHGARSWFKSV